MANDKCPECGALYAMVGFKHRCVPRAVPRTGSSGNTAAPSPPQKDSRPQSGNYGRTSGRSEQPAAARTRSRESQGANRVTAGETAPVAYKYRDPEKRRAYMRELMRKRRAEASK